MIQRIQSIWLLLASSCAFLTLKLSFFSGNILVDNQKQFVKLTAINGGFFLLVLTCCVAVGALILIFLFKDRQLQLKIIIAMIAVAVLNIVLYFVQAGHYVPNEGNYDLSSALSFAIPVFFILAARNIYKDEKLVRSADRIR